MSYVLGLTGSIGMGKTTTAAMFFEQGIPVWDADAVVRGLYSEDGAATKLIAKYYPEAMENGAVSRPKLRALISKNPEILDHIQTLVHPLVAQDRADFLNFKDAPIVLLDIPLLFETGASAECDGIAVVSVSPELQRDRVLNRGEMTEEDFEMILKRQMPDAEKRSKATWVIDTSTLEIARQSVVEIISEITASLSDA